MGINFFRQGFNGVNLVMNILMLTPLHILAYNVNKRHQFLIDTIGPLPEEIDAHWKINFLVNYMILIFVGAALLQFLSYFLYNRVFHPFQDLMTEPGIKTFILAIAIFYFKRRQITPNLLKKLLDKYRFIFAPICVKHKTSSNFPLANLLK